MTDYRKEYDDLIATARIESVKYTSGFVIHHIVPKSLGGSDEPSNLVRLWPTEHLKAHWLLSKFLLGSERRKMERVFEQMLMNSGVSHESKRAYRIDARDDAARCAAISPSRVSRREGLSLAATKFLASEMSRRGRRPLTKH